MANEKQLISCPQCGSTEIFKQKLPNGKGIIISFFVLGFPLPFLKRTYHCFECNLDFRVKTEEQRQDDKPKNQYDP